MFGISIDVLGMFWVSIFGMYIDVFGLGRVLRFFVSSFVGSRCGRLELEEEIMN